MPTFNITVMQVEAKSAISKAGKPYELVEVAFKNNSFQGKLESFKVITRDPVLKSAVLAMQQGQTYDVEREKDGDFWKWLKVAPAVAGISTSDASSHTPSAPVKPAFQPNNYPTAEERAQTQVYIVKQSSITAAVNLLTTGAKVPPSTETILEQAQKFVDFVFEEKRLSSKNLLDIADDLDEVE